MPSLLRRRSLGLAAVAVTLPVLAAVLHAVATPWRPTGDFGLIELHAMDVPAHMPLFGVYSRFGFHHPGPLLFALYALPARLFGPVGLLVGAGLINGAALVASVIVLRRRGGVPLLVIGTLGLLLLELAASGQLVDPWNPWVPMFPFLLAVLLAWSVWERDWWALPALVAVLSLCVQAHLGYLLLAGWLAVVAVVAMVRARHELRSRRQQRNRVLAVSGAVALVLWSLPLWDLFRNEPANLRVMADYLLHGSPSTVGLADAAHMLGRELGWVPPALGGPESHLSGTDVVAGSWVAGLPALLLLAGAAVLAVRRRDRPPLGLLGVTGGGLVVGWISLAHVEGTPHAYLLRWVWPLVTLALVAAVWAVQRAVAAAMADRPVEAPGEAPGEEAVGGGRRGAPAAAVVAVVAVVAVLAVTASVGAGRATLPAPGFSESIAALGAPVAAGLRGRGVVLMPHQPGTWAEEEDGMVADLQRRGIDVFVPDPDAFSYGPERAIGDRVPDAILVIAVDRERQARRAGSGPAGSVLLASYDSLGPDERRQADEQQASLTVDDLEARAQADPRGRAVDVYLDPPP